MASVHLDTNIFIWAFETDAATAAPVRDFFRHLRKFKGAAITSELTIAELIAPSMNRVGICFEARRRYYTDLLVNRGFVATVPVALDILIATAEYRRTSAATGHRVRLADAVHVCSAMQAGCRFLLSADMRLGALPEGMQKISGSPDDLDMVLRAL